MSFDLAVQDFDADGSFSWISWGFGTGKYGDIDRTGDLVFDASQDLGTLQGRVVRDNGGSAGLTGVLIRSSTDTTFHINVETDSEGAFGIDLPAGSYRVVPKSQAAALDSAAVAITPGQTTPASVTLGPARGQRLAAGPGRKVAAGSGTRQRQWNRFEAADGLLRSSVLSLAQGLCLPFPRGLTCRRRLS